MKPHRNAYYCDWNRRNYSKILKEIKKTNDAIMRWDPTEEKSLGSLLFLQEKMEQLYKDAKWQSARLCCT